MPQPTYAGQVAFITGAASGLGRALAQALAAEGAAIAALDLQADGLQSLAQALAPRPCATVVADVTQPAAMRDAVQRCEQQLGPIELLIASAGVGFETSALTFRAEDIEKLVRVNLLGVANSIDAVLPGMLARKRGQLAAISSIASYRGVPLMAGYCATKAGVNALLDSLRVELRPHGIAVSTICPGWIRTPMTANVKLPLKQLMEADAAARLIVAALRRRQPFCAFPAPLVRQMRLLRWLPLSWSDWLVGRMLGKLKKG